MSKPKSSKSRGKNSAIIIAQLLSTQGFTDHTAAEVERYWRAKSGLSERQRRHLEELDRALAEMAAKLTPGDRLVMGKFIGLQKKMSFDVGLKIGLQAFAQRQSKEIETPEQIKLNR